MYFFSNYEYLYPSFFSAFRKEDSLILLIGYFSLIHFVAFEIVQSVYSLSLKMLFMQLICYSVIFYYYCY